ncbi:acidic mammalian chitinase-like [Boleophthalmus pectinirostris]|uniref:acidic mammalian chitinase-like n=1 Tax=Boleophthalmus pectinirostris TaxID=150288 RepID=UPI00242FBB56|nr:acidic mammalian chitinase-like [Boleophthalmus pectinirostris]
MSRLLLIAGVWLALATITSCRLVCYYDGEAASRDSTGRFTPANIDPELCTHLIYAFAVIDNQNKLVPINNNISLYKDLNNLKTKNSQLKTMLAVGGPNFDNQKFSTMVAAANTRSSFITSAIALIKDNGFDGLNLDWQYPGDGQPQDKTRFTSLCQELRTAFQAENPPLLLSASVSAVKAMIDKSYEVAKIASEVDFLNVLTFGFHDTSETKTAHHSPLGALTAGDILTTEYAMAYWKNLGAPKNKLNMAFAAYGVAFTLTDPSNSGVGAPASGPAEPGCYGGTAGIWSYYEICLYIKGGDLRWIPEQSVPYTVTEGQWVGYDNTTSIDAKVKHIVDNGYGGACVWALDLDDYTGQFCQIGSNPFISHLKSKLPATTTTTTTGGDVCNGKTGLHPNPENNTTFYNCDHGTGTLQSCNADLIFCDSCKCCNRPSAC